MHIIHIILKPIVLFLLILSSCRPSQTENVSQMTGSKQSRDLETEASLTLDRYHRAAAEAHFDEYFGLMGDSSVFVGTDPGEHWSKPEFMDYARPHFARGKAWTMKAVERQLHFSADSTLVWFEELLDTRMKLCRGSGVMSRHGRHWLIEQYVLSPTVPNPLMKEIVGIKQSYDDSLLNKIAIKSNVPNNIINSNTIKTK